MHYKKSPCSTSDASMLLEKPIKPNEASSSSARFHRNRSYTPSKLLTKLRNRK